VGETLARRLLAGGHRVRIAKRSPLAGLGGAEVVTGDATDAGFCASAAAGARAVYHCMNPPYDAKMWADVVPRYMENLIVAAGRAGARLIVLDNVYMLGRPGGKPLGGDTPMNPCSRKGEIRARAAERLFAAHAKGEVQAVAGRASDYYGPGGRLTYMGDFFWPDALAGKTVRVPVDPDAVHTYHYIPDVAEALMTLGTTAADVCGRPWMLPCAPAVTLRDHAKRFEKHLGRAIDVAAAPRWMLSVLGLFMAPVREMAEMRYQWEEPFVIDDAPFRERFGAQPAEVDEAARATVEWAKRAYAKA
jgi:nucleoside-diphosphate-sugar epimerase